MAAGILLGLFLAALVWVVARNPSGEAVTQKTVREMLAYCNLGGIRQIA
jgi:hypothetical protein